MLVTWQWLGLFGMYFRRPVPSYRYSTWQFRTDDQPVDCLAKIMTVLRDFDPILPA